MVSEIIKFLPILFGQEHLSTGGWVSVTLLRLNLKPQKYLMNPLIRSDSIARLGSIYMATIKQKESIVGLLKVVCSTSLGVKKVTVWKAVLVRRRNVRSLWCF